MLAIDTKTARIVWTVLFLLGVLLLLYALRSVLILFIFALLLAYLVSPLFNALEPYFPRRISRTASLLVSYFLLISFVGLIFSFIATQVASQAGMLAERLTTFAPKVREVLLRPLPEWLEPYRPTIERTISQQLDLIAVRILGLFEQAGPTLMGLVSNVIYTVIIAIASFFFLRDGPKLLNSLLSSIPSDTSRQLVSAIFEDIHSMLGRFIRALVLISLITFTTFALVLYVLRVPYSLLMATLAGILEFIPIFGPLTAGIAIVSLSLLGGYTHWTVLIGFLILYRIVLDYVIIPLVMGAELRLHPLLVIFGVFAGEELGGVAGMFLSVPVIAALRLIFLRTQAKPQTVFQYAEEIGDRH